MRTVPPPAPKTVAHSEFVYPTVPPALKGRPGAELIDIGWRYLQSDDTSNADRTFTQALKRNAALYPARAGQGYVALAKREFSRALSDFDAALKAGPSYVPALVGRGQALLALGRDQEALPAFEAALAADSTLTDVRRRVDVLRFRGIQDTIQAARDAVRKGHEADARAAYARAIAASPESAFLYRELGLLDRKTAHPEQALQEFNRAVDLDPTDAGSYAQIAELLDERGDFAGAEAAYRKAADLEPGPELSARLASSTKRAREARLPPEFKGALTSPQLTRGQLAALIGVRLDDLLREAPDRQVVITDTRSHWAAEWIAPVARAGVMDPFENHTFQPEARVRRGDLATAVSRVLALVAMRDPELRTRLSQRPAIADVTPRHAQYTAVAAAVSSGVMPLLGGDRFQVAQGVTGAEAVDAIERIRALAARTQPGSAF
jgi:tetratricopeptide (TPR) repeat protein